MQPVSAFNEKTLKLSVNKLPTRLDCSNMFCLTWETCIWSFLYFDNDETSKIGDVLTEHGGLLHVLPLAVHLNFLSLVFLVS